MSERFAHIQIDPPKLLAEMRNHPRADKGQPVGIIPGTAVVPVVQDDPPVYDSRTHELERTESVTPGEVRRGWSVRRRDARDVVASIKATAGEVIERVVPAWKQRNILADIVVHLDIAAKPKNDQAYRRVWQWIQEVREESGSKEAAAIAGDVVDLDSWPEFTP